MYILIEKPRSLFTSVQSPNKNKWEQAPFQFEVVLTLTFNLVYEQNKYQQHPEKS